MKFSPRSLNYGIDKFSVYLPVFVMALLALATFWLARNAPTFVQEVQVDLTSTDPDYAMRDFAVRTYAGSGNLTVQIYGESGQHYPVRDLLEVHRIRVRFVADNGRVTTASAQTGTSNGKGTEMSLRGNAVVVQEPLAQSPRLEFQGEELLLWPEENRVQSNLPVTLLRGADRMSGDTLYYDKNRQQIEIKGRVRTTLQP